MKLMVNAQDILAAAERIRSVVRTTPADYSIALSELTGCQVWLKLEHLQHTGSFKLRGAANKLHALSPSERECGVITASNGNHGIAVCYAAKQLGIRPRVFVRNG